MADLAVGGRIVGAWRIKQSTANVASALNVKAEQTLMIFERPGVISRRLSVIRKG
jgi:hypothetical protein